MRIRSKIRKHVGQSWLHAAILSYEITWKIGPSPPIRSLALTLILTTPPRWKRGRFHRGSMLERAAINNGKRIANGAACDRGYLVRTWYAHVSVCTSPVRMCASSWPGGIARRIQLILHSQPRKFRGAPGMGGERQKENRWPARRDICETLLSR